MKRDRERFVCIETINESCIEECDGIRSRINRPKTFHGRKVREANERKRKRETERGGEEKEGSDELGREN